MRAIFSIVAVVRAFLAGSTPTFATIVDGAAKAKKASMKRSRWRALGALSIGVATCGGFWAPSSGEAATVFSSYTGSFCFCGADSGIVAEGFFMPAAGYDFAGAAAYILHFNDFDQEFSLALYSSTSAGEPDAALWSATVVAPAAHSGDDFISALVSANYAGPPILLQSGVEYFLAVDLDNGDLAWLGGEGSLPTFVHYSEGWAPATLIFANDLQFEVYGDPAVPEPSTWAMMLAGFAGLGFLGYRASHKSVALA